MQQRRHAVSASAAVVDRPARLVVCVLVRGYTFVHFYTPVAAILIIQHAIHLLYVYQYI